MSEPAKAQPPHDPYASPSEPPSHSISPSQAMTSGRPTGVTAFAILCFVFGTLGLFGMLGSVVLLFSDAPASAENPVVELCRTNQFYLIFTIVSTILGAVFMIVQFAAGFSLLKMSPVGRKLILAYAVYGIIAAIVVNTVNYFYLLPVMKAQMNAKAANAPPGAQQIIEASMMVGMVGGVAFALLFPAAILWYFNKRNVKERFAVA